MIRTNKTYLKENRLADVIALIQVLAFANHSHRTINGLNQELQGMPISASSWEEVAKEHPEFFRVKKTKEDIEKTETPKISLITRYVQLGNGKTQSDTLSPDMAMKFFETAIQLHDIQKERSRKLFLWLPLIIAVFATIFSVAGAIYTQHLNNENQALLKHYELELRPKQENYANFMKNINRAFYAAHNHAHQDYFSAIEQVESSFYIFEPFLSPSDREHMWNDYQQFLGLCSEMITKDSSQINDDDVYDSFILHKNQFRSYLYRALFDTPMSNQ